MQKQFTKILVLPKSIGKVKRRLQFESDEEEGGPCISKSRKAQILDELLPSTSTADPKPKPPAAVTTPAATPASTSTATVDGRPALLATPTLPVYHLRLEDFKIEDIVVKVSF